MNKYIFSFFILFNFMSCSDLLDVTPKDKITDVSYWEKAEDFKLVANGFYTFLEAMGPKDLNADVATSWTRDTESNGTYVPSEESSVWNDSYSQLRTVNYLCESGVGNLIQELKINKCK